MTEQRQPADGAEEVVGAGETAEPTTAEAALQGDILDDGEVTPTAGESASPAADADGPDASADLHPDTFLAAERLSDLQRLQAEYVNYKRRVDRDRAVVQERAARSVIEALLPVLDDIHAAREHGDLTEGPFSAIADKLEKIVADDLWPLPKYSEILFIK